MSKIQITHIYHSGFRIDSQDKVIFIDVYNNFENLGDLSGKKVYFLATHSHGDHYNEEIFNFRNDNVKYVLSNDIKVKEHVDTHLIENGDSILLDGIEIEAFGTTDLGISFLLNVDGNKIFHSGDLNWWHWSNDSTEVQNKEKDDYQREIARLLGKEIDFAFVPVDPRLEGGMCYAINYFIDTIKPKVAIPMHFASDFDVTANLSSDTCEILQIKNSLEKIY